MHVDYKCPNCETNQEASFSIIQGPPKEVFCEKCGQIMQRIWKSAIHIPEDFSDDLTTTISQRMAHAPRPTGRSKVIF
jgi:uncharacterized Zn finger protein